jgi:O-antigen ligase
MHIRESAYAARPRVNSLPLISGVVAVALLAGCAVALAGAAMGSRAIYLVAVPGILGVGAAFALTRTEPLRFMFLVLLAVLPFSNILLPPGRLNITVFDAATLVLTCGLLVHKAFARETDSPLFPARSLWLCFILLIPSVIFAWYPLKAAQALLLIFAAYVFFWFVLQELRRPGGMERLIALLCLSVILVSGGLFIDHWFQINLSMRGSNPNQLTLSGGQYIWRAGGFFQDPQKAGAFLASLLMFLLVLGVRGRCRTAGLRLLLLGALALGLAAMFLTVSRAAILSFLIVAAVALLAMNRWPSVLKAAGILALVLIAVTLVTVPDFWMGLLPGNMAERVAQSQVELAYRMEIWSNTWEMFEGQPVTGIGMGGFQQYLIDTRPGTTDYFGTYEYTGMTYIPDQPESGYLKILYETGILGSLAVLVLIGATLRRAIRALVDGGVGEADRRTEVVAVLASLAVFAGTYATLFTTGDPRLLALFAIFVAVIWRQSVPALHPPRS